MSKHFEVKTRTLVSKLNTNEYRITIKNTFEV